MFQKVIYHSVKNKILVLFGVLLLIIAGIFSMQNLALDAVPDITNNQVQVVTVSPSLATQEVEQFITYPLELALNNIPGVVEVRSISRFGLSIITVVFNEKVNALNTRQLVSEQISLVSEEIPKSMGAPELMPITTGLGEIYQYTLQVDDAYKNQYSLMDLRTIQDWVIKRQLSGLEGIIEVSSFGGFLKQYEVAVDPFLLRSYNLTLIDVYEALATQNENSGSSYIEKDNKAYYIRTEGLITDFDDMAQIVVGNNDHRPILVKDVAQVKLGTAKRFGALTYSGQGEAVGGITLMYKGANAYKTLQRVQERIVQIEKTLPSGVHIVPFLDRSTLIDKTIATVFKNLFEGGLIVIVVLLLLLGNFRAGLVVASIIPLSLLFAFVLMNLFGVSANLMSLGAIDFGIVVDGAVIITEGVLFAIGTQYFGQKLSPQALDKVVIHSAGGIYKEAAYGVFIILVVFVPLLSLDGIEGKMFRPMALTVSFALLGAMILSISYVPVMLSLVLKREIRAKLHYSDKFLNLLKNWYEKVLYIILKKARWVIIFSVAAFIGAIWLFGTLGAVFTPSLGEGDLAMQMALPPGSSLQKSIEKATEAEQLLMENFPEIIQIVSKIGTAEVPTDPMAIEDADVMIILKDQKDWTSANNREDLAERMKEKLEQITDVTFEFTQPIQLRFNELMTGAKSDVVVKIFGDDLEKLTKLADDAALIIEEIPGADDVRIEKTAGLPQLLIKFNRKQLAYYGVSIQTLNEIIGGAYSGNVVGNIYEADRKFDLVVRLKQPEANNPNLAALFVKANNGQLVPLTELATIDRSEGPMQISRESGKRRIVVGINVRSRDVASVVADVQQALDTKMDWPSGYNVVYGGEFEKLQSAINRLQWVVPVALIVILLLLYMAFNSMPYALLVFVAVPLSVIGGIAALWIRDMPFSLSAGVGFIALFGVSVLNGVVLISRLNELKKEGEMELKELIILGCGSRIRPVLMTALVASLGFLPMALSESMGAEVQRPLATVVIGGLVSATLLTLLVLPVLYFKMQTMRFSFKSKKALFILFGLSLATIAKAQDGIQIHQILEQLPNKHPLLINAQKDIEIGELQKAQTYHLDPININWQHGQIDGYSMDNNFTVMQNLGNFANRWQQAKLSKTQLVLSEASFVWLQKSLLFEVEALHLSWSVALMQWREAQVLQEKLAQLLLVADKQLQAGDISLLDHKLLKANSSGVLLAVQELQWKAQALERQLKQKAYLEANTSIIPATKFSDEDLLTIPEINSAYLQLLKSEVQVAQNEWSLARSNNWPEMQIGYFNQSLDKITGYDGVIIGVNIPISFWSQKNAIAVQQTKWEQAQEIQNIAVNEAENKLKQNFDSYQQMRKSFLDAKIETSESQNILQMSLNALESGEINYQTFYQHQAIVQQLIQNYYSLLLQYQNTILEIKYLSN